MSEVTLSSTITDTRLAVLFKLILELVFSATLGDNCFIIDMLSEKD